MAWRRSVTWPICFSFIGYSGGGSAGLLGSPDIPLPGKSAQAWDDVCSCPCCTKSS